MPRAVDPAKGSRFVLLATFCIVIGALYFAREVLIPVALAILLSFLLSPVVQWLERLKLPRMVATLIVVLVGLGLLGGVGYMVGKQAVSIVNELPTYQVQLRAKLQKLGEHGGFIKRAEKGLEDVTGTKSTPHADPHAGVPPAPPTAFPGLPIAVGDHAAPSQPTPENPTPVRIFPAAPTPFQMLREYASSVLSPLTTFGLVLVFVIFMLLSREDLRDRVIRLLGHGRLNLTTQALDEASTRISSYLGALAIVNVCYALCTALGLWLIGRMLGHGQKFPNVLVWGILVGLFRFVPYIGIWIGAGIPLLLSFALFPGNGVFFGTIALFAVLEVVVGQFIEPMWYGSSTGMSALAVLVAAVFWAWLWGPVGLLLSTPLTVILVVMGKYIPQLKFLDILLREESVLSLHYRFYQRLVAMDQEEAADLARDYLTDKQSLEAAFDDLLIPALSLSEHDSHRDRLGDEQLQFIRQSVRDLIEELAEQYRTVVAPGAVVEAETAARNADKPVSALSHAVTAAATTMASVASNVAHAVAGTSKTAGDTPASVANNGQVRPEAAKPLPNLPQGCLVNVLCLPARDEADELVSLMFAQLLQLRGYCALTPSAAVLASEMVDMVEAKKVDLVCVSAMPPAAVAHARYLCKRLHARHPDIGTMVGLWTLKPELIRKAQDRIACSTSVPVVTTLHEAQEQMEQMSTRPRSRWSK